MSTEIYYFPGADNSFHVAKETEKKDPKTKLITSVLLLDKKITKPLSYSRFSFSYPSGNGSCAYNRISQ